MARLPVGLPGGPFMVDSALPRHAAPMRTLPVVLSGILCAFMTTTVHADALRCGNRLIREGDTRAFVRSFCGEPADVQTRYVLRRPYYNSSNGFAYYDNAVEVPVE